MMLGQLSYHAYGFVDGAYLRHLAKGSRKPLVNPRQLVEFVANTNAVQSWAAVLPGSRTTVLTRVIYYDARPDDDAAVQPDLLEYWKAVELLDDTELGFGSLRGGGRGKAPRQKGVDTLIAVDMLVGAFTKLFAVAIRGGRRRLRSGR